MSHNTLSDLARQIGMTLQQKGQKLVTAESCTGGLIAEAITRIPGSSEWFERGFVTYSVESKMELLGVSEELLSRFGAVSEPVAKQMATGALAKSHGDVAIATTGIAGPDGGTPNTPVGFVWIAWANANATDAKTFRWTGSRLTIRKEAAKAALLELLTAIPRWP